MANVICSTKDMSKIDWLKIRQQGIGGSDAGAILGVSEYKTAFHVYMDKTEEIKEENQTSEAAYWGNQLEDMVAREFTKQTGKKVRRRNQLLQHEKYSFMFANLDRDVIGEKAFLECKTVNAYGAKDWEGDDIPASYLIQVMHYMAITGDEKCYIAVLIGGQKFKWKEIKRDNDLIDILIQQERFFWENNVMEKNPPRLDGSSAAEKYLAERFKVAEPGKIVLLKSEFANRLDQLQEIKENISILKEQAEEIENNIKYELGEAEEGYAPGYKVTWKQIVSKKADTKALKMKYPDIYKEVEKDSLSRRFSIKSMKEDESKWQQQTA